MRNKSRIIRLPLPLNEFDELLKELDNDIKKFFNSGKKTAETINKIYDVGKREGMSKEVIRNKIELVVTGRIKARQLRKLLPADLKRVYTKSIIPELTHNPVILVDGKLEDPDNAIPSPPPPILDKKTLKERENLPDVIACRIVSGHFEVIAQDLIDYPISKGDPIGEELALALEEHYGLLMNPKDKKYKHLTKKMKDFYKSEEYKQLNTSARLMNPDGTPIFKEITKEQGVLSPLITTQYEHAVRNYILSRLFIALIKYYRKYVQPWVEKRAMDVNRKLKLK